MSATPKTETRYTQRQLAMLLGVPQQTVCVWTGKSLLPKPATVGSKRLYLLSEVIVAIAHNALSVKPPIPLDQI